MDAKFSQFFSNVCSLLQRFTTYKLFEDRFPNKSFDRQAGPNGPWSDTRADLHQPGIAHAFEKKPGSF